MAIIKSAKKALRQSLGRKKRNLVYKKKIKDLVKEVKKLVLAKTTTPPPPSQSSTGPLIEEAKKLLPQIYKILDKAAKVGVIKKNTASRRKSRITKAILREIRSR